MQKKEVEKDRITVFESLISDNRKKDNLRKVLKQFNKTLDDYNRLWQKNKYL